MKSKYLVLIAAVLLFNSCKKNGFKVTDQVGTEGKALVKLGLFHMTTLATPLVVYNNGNRMSGAIASPYPFPGGGYNTGGGTGGDYLTLEPGVNKFELFTVFTGTLNNSSKFFETTQTVEANKKYTIYSTDTLSNSTAVMVSDDANSPDSGFARIRFINLIPNSGSVDFYKGTSLLKSNISFKQFTEFFDVVSTTTDAFSIRPTGALLTTTPTATYTLAINTNQRILSFVCRGYIGAIGTRIPSVSVCVNQ